jgi:hypothetical protein
MPQQDAANQKLALPLRPHKTPVTCHFGAIEPGGIAL